MSRLRDIQRFYAILERLTEQVGGVRTLNDFSKHRDWPRRGVYFFFEPGEMRSDSGGGLRVVRVGTHALAAGSKSSLRQRLSQHRGNTSGGGNHRSSIFRLLVGEALLKTSIGENCASWGVKGDAGNAAAHLRLDSAAMKAAELPVERLVSQYIGALPFLWLHIEDEPGPDSKRALIERNAIALLSNLDRDAVDAPSDTWLGKDSGRDLVRRSGLWNQRHVDEPYKPAFLDTLDALISSTPMV